MSTHSLYTLITLYLSFVPLISFYLGLFLHLFHRFHLLLLLNIHEIGKPFEMFNGITDCTELWKLAVKIHHKWKVTTTMKEHFEMVVVDKQGHDIHVVVPTIFRQAFDSGLSVNMTCTMSNFQVQPNHLIFKPTPHKYLLKFTGGTRIGDIGKYDIPDKVINLTPFADIISGKWPKNLLINVIGVIDEIGYSQPQFGGKKPQVNLVLRDLCDNALHCTLWKAMLWSSLTTIKNNFIRQHQLLFS
ncbi:unnamed protein product [Lathyrus sativus]|nr:unnamed protein product [Lathyrus sativus]